MKTLLLLTLGVALIAVSGCRRAEAQAHSGWLTDFEKAKQLAAETGRPILADFSGSDWCGWCIKLDREVFSQSAFSAFASEKVILFLADFPSKQKQTEELVHQNQALLKEYGVQGFPTVLVLDATGEVKARTGYRPGGADEYVKHLAGLLEQKDEAVN